MFKAAAGLTLASLVSAAPAKADLFNTTPDYSYINNSSYVETHQEETPSQAFEHVLETPEILEAPFVPQPNLFPADEIRISARHITVEDYLEQNNIDFNSQFTTSWWEYPLNIGGGYIASLVLHEFGHYTLAQMFGAQDVEMHILDGQCGSAPGCVKFRMQTCRDRLCRDVDRYVGQLQETLIYAGGVLFTTGGNIAITSLLEEDLVPDWSRSFVATTSLFMMADRHAYIWNNAIKHWMGKESPGNDISNIVNSNFSSPEARDAAFGVLVAASAVELALRWEEIWYLVNTAIGRQVEVPKGLGILPGLYPYGSVLMLGASGEF